MNNAFFDPYTGKEADKFQAYRGIVVTWEKMKLKNDPTLPNVSLSLSFSVYSLCFRLRSITNLVIMKFGLFNVIDLSIHSFDSMSRLIKIKQT